MTSDEKIAYVDAQIRAVRAGWKNEIACPYCAVVSKPPENPDEDAKPCCDLFVIAVVAVLDRLAAEDRAELAYEIADKVASN